MPIFAQDLRYAVRKLLRTPSFTLIALATMALAVGATTAVFSVVNAVLLEPLPFRDPDQLVRLETLDKQNGAFPLSPADYLDYREQNSSFSDLAQFALGSANLSSDGTDPARLDRLMVGPSFFSVLGVQPLRGRFFASNEGTPEAPNVVVISDRAWRSRFAASPSVIGRSIMLDERPYTIIGVAPPTANYPQPVDLWIPRAILPSSDPSARGAHQFFAIGRLKRGISVAKARADVVAIAKRLGQQYPQMDSPFSGTITPLKDQLVGNVRPTLFALLGAVAFVLLIACANVANLLLVRASTRAGEMAVRTALGASTGRIARQLIAESLLLSTVGTVLGVSLAAWGVHMIVALGPSSIPRLQDVAINGRVLAVSAAVAILTGLAFGLIPAMYAARPDIAGMLRVSGRNMSRGGMNRLRSAFVVAELVLAVVLLVGAGLLIKSFYALMHVNPGFRVENVVTFDLPLPAAKYKTDQAKIALTSELQSRLSALPGAQSVGVTFGRPLARQLMMTAFDVVGQPPNDPMHRTITEVHAASPSYFSAMGMTIKRGRVYTESENRRDGHQVVLVNEELARRYFPGQQVVGKTIQLGVGYNEQLSPADTNGVTGEIVGVVGDVKQRGLSSDAFPSVYVPFNALPGGFTSFAVRSRASAATVEAAVREEVRRADPHLPVVGLSAMEDVVADSVGQPRFYMVLLSIFGGIALLLAAIGIYGVISYTVAQRSREMGIRIALGAPQGRVIWGVLRESLGLTVAGVAGGLLAAAELTRLIRGMLFDVGAMDVTAFGGVAVLLALVSLAASWLPARRAAAVDPLIAMRTE